MLEHKVHQLCRLHVAGKAQRFQHLGGRDGAARRRALIQQAQRVAQRSVGQSGEQLRPVGLEVDLFLRGDVGQARFNVVRQDAPEGKALAAGEDRGGHLVQLGGGEDEHQVRGRFL